MVNELIKITTNNEGQQLVSARELYLGLGLNKAAWSRWHKTNIQSNEFFEENIDWVGVQHDVEGNETMDFAISIEFAKHIAMMTRTEKSHEYRKYFIECEKVLKENKFISSGTILSELHQSIMEIENPDKRATMLLKLYKEVNNIDPIIKVNSQELLNKSEEYYLYTNTVSDRIYDKKAIITMVMSLYRLDKNSALRLIKANGFIDCTSKRNGITKRVFKRTA